MKFACNSHAKTINESVNLWIRDNQTRNAKAFALLDGSMFPVRVVEQWHRQSSHLELALAGTRFEGYGRQGPLLWDLDSLDAATLDELLYRTNGIPALSFITPRQGVEALRQSLAWLAEAHTEDGQTLHFRLADTRFIPVLLDTLERAQRATLATGILEWAWIGRNGYLQSRLLDESGEPPDPSGPFALAAAQFDGLMIHAEPDMVFQMLFERMPECLPDEPPHSIHERLTRLIKTARSYGIDDMPDLFVYAVTGLSTRDDFDQHPVIQLAWPRLKYERLRFRELAQQWPEKVWQDLRPAP